MTRPWFQHRQYLPCCIQMMHGHAHGITRRAVHLFSIPRQSEEIILDQIPQPVLYIQQQAVKLISGSSVDIHWSSPIFR
jgi:hypothetical protein